MFEKQEIVESSDHLRNQEETYLLNDTYKDNFQRGLLSTDIPCSPSSGEGSPKPNEYTMAILQNTSLQQAELEVYNDKSLQAASVPLLEASFNKIWNEGALPKIGWYNRPWNYQMDQDETQKLNAKNFKLTEPKTFTTNRIPESVKHYESRKNIKLWTEFNDLPNQRKEEDILYTNDSLGMARASMNQQNDQQFECMMEKVIKANSQDRDSTGRSVRESMMYDVSERPYTATRPNSDHSDETSEFAQSTNMEKHASVNRIRPYRISNERPQQYLMRQEEENFCPSHVNRGGYSQQQIPVNHNLGASFRQMLPR